MRFHDSANLALQADIGNNDREGSSRVAPRRTIHPAQSDGCGRLDLSMLRPIRARDAIAAGYVLLLCSAGIAQVMLRRRFEGVTMGFRRGFEGIKAGIGYMSSPPVRFPARCNIDALGPLWITLVSLFCRCRMSWRRSQRWRAAFRLDEGPGHGTVDQVCQPKRHPRPRKSTFAVLMSWRPCKPRCCRIIAATW